MSIYLALDAGGTKTETIVHDETGHILLRNITKGCNAMDMGVEETVRRAEFAIREASGSIPGGKPDRAYCGIASVDYYGATLRTALSERFPDWNIRWEDDGWGMITSAIGARDGCCIVCGTGTSLFARVNGGLHHVGGWGYLIDTWGSGYVLGREAIRAALRQTDGRGPNTKLYKLVCDKLGAPPETSIPTIYEGGRPFIASFAGTVFAARKQGDAVAEAIFDQGAEAVAEFTHAAERYFTGNFDVVLSGGIFAAFPEYAQAVQRKGSVRANMIRPEVPPVCGCALENALADGPVNENLFRAAFMKDYVQMKK